MSDFTIIRPELEEDKRTEIESYLQERHLRMVETKREYESKVSVWLSNYDGIPLEKIRHTPWHKSSNVVVKVCRMFVDAFVARSLNLIFATRPLYVSDTYPRDVKEGLEMYLNWKALFDWDHYNLARNMLFRGAKTGLSVQKTPWVEKNGIWVNMGVDGEKKEQDVLMFSGPKAECIPFEDFFCLPIEIEKLSEADIICHRLRFTEDQARERNNRMWKLPDEDLEVAFEGEVGVYMDRRRTDAGLTKDSRQKWLMVSEMHFKYAITNDSSKSYDMIAVFLPKSKKMVDIYHRPYPPNIDLFHEYIPYPREGLIFGDSMVSILDQSQEEVSTIHNERRNANSLACGPVFKRKKDALVPNPSDFWYPGKVWDLEEMDDLEVMTIGGTISPDLIAEENLGYQIAERLSGVGMVMQSPSVGGTSRSGTYNTGGTLALLQAGNQRQDTNIRDVRCVLGKLARHSLALQKIFGSDDPAFSRLPESMQKNARAAFQTADSDMVLNNLLEIKMSNAGANAEVEKSSLMQLSQVVGSYGEMAMKLSQSLADPSLNPVLKDVMLQTLTMYKWMASRLLRVFDQYDAEEVLPDVAKALESARGGATAQEVGGFPAGAEGMVPGGAGPNSIASQRSFLETLSQVPTVPA